MTSATSSITLHSSWRGLALGAIGGAVVTAAGAYSTASTDGAVGSLVLLLIGVAILAVIALDLPVASEFTGDGVTRRPLLRRHHLSWDRVDQLTRTRPSIAARARNLAPGGLVAKVGRRRYLLVDQCESLAEYGALAELLEEASIEVSFDDLIVPPEGVDPTWTYRRRRWQPSRAGEATN